MKIKSKIKNQRECFYCGYQFDNFETRKTIDHIVPLSRGGGNEKENLIGACKMCNTLKGDMFLHEWHPTQGIKEKI